MAERLETKIEGSVAVLTLASGPGGRGAVLDAEARAALMVALDFAEADAAVHAVVITGQGRGFPGDLPVEEIAGGEAAPALTALCQRIGDFPKPVVAALRGDVFDAGLALALAAHARLAVAGTRLGFAAIRRGLVPGGGATQRLPRLVGAGPALEMIFSGRILPATSGHLRGLFRRIVAKNVVGEALEAARALAGEGGEPAEEPWPGLADPGSFQEAIAQRREAARPLPPEAEAVLTLVEAAQLLPLEAGLAMEGDLRDELRRTARAKGLIRSTALEMRAARAEAPPPRNVTILGDGALAQDLARRALAGGLSVVLAEQRAGGAREAIGQVAAVLEGAVARGQLSAGERDARLARLSGGASQAVLEGADPVIEACEAGPELVPGLAGLIAEATGGSGECLLSSGMALRAGRLRDVLGVRLFGLALSAHPGLAGRGLAEIAVTGVADAAAVVRAEALIEALDYRAVLCPAHDGLIAARLKAALLAAALWCVARGAGPGEVDAALGWPVGPFRQADAEGLARAGERLAALGWPADFAAFGARFVEAGRTGRDSGAGVFRYDGAGGTATEDAEAAALLADWRGAAAAGGAALSPAVIRRRVWSALFSAGLRLLEDGTAEPGDIDLAGLEALGLPRASGGPMKTGEIRGLLAVKRELEAWEAEAPALWQGSALLAEMVKQGEGFGY